MWCFAVYVALCWRSWQGCPFIGPSGKSDRELDLNSPSILTYFIPVPVEFQLRLFPFTFSSLRLFIYLIYYKIVHTVQDRQNGQSNIKSGIKAK